VCRGGSRTGCLQGVANRDLPLLKICDFGYSKHEMNSSAKTGVGTPVYMAPEVILGDQKYDAKVTGLLQCLQGIC